MSIYISLAIGVVFICLGLFYKKTDLANENVEKSSQKMIAQLEETAQRILAEVDTKTKKLEILLEEAHLIVGKMKSTKNLTPLEEKREKILNLLDEGKDLVEVAKMLKMGKGEIQLVLDLGKTGWGNGKNN